MFFQISSLAISYVFKRIFFEKKKSLESKHKEKQRRKNSKTKKRGDQKKRLKRAAKYEYNYI